MFGLGKKRAKNAKQVRYFGGKRYAFNCWMPTKEAVRRYRKDRGGYMRAVRGRSSEGNLGYLIYVA